MGAAGAGIILLIRSYVIGLYNITPETKQIAWKLMDAIALIVVFQSVNGVMTKGVLRGRWGYSFSDGSRCSVPLDCICSARSTCRTVLASGCFLDLCIFEAGSGDKSGLVRISFKEPKVDQDAFNAANLIFTIWKRKNGFHLESGRFLSTFRNGSAGQ